MKDSLQKQFVEFEVYGPDTLKERMVRKWFARFRVYGNISVSCLRKL